MAHWIPWDEAVALSGRADSTLYEWCRKRGIDTWKQWDRAERRWLRFVDQDGLLQVLPNVKPGPLRKLR